MNKNADRPSFSDLGNLEKYKLHSAITNPRGWNPYQALINSVMGRVDPDKRTWQEWSMNAPLNQPFNRPYIFAMARIPEMVNRWLFGGIFSVAPGEKEVMDRVWAEEKGREIYEYDISLTNLWCEYIGKMEIEFDKPDGRTVSV